ncbi:hypothetical protein GJV82_18725 [Cellulosimicrobium sp. BIT-GX5]|uniref:Uncharacterized protein n=1 Tax=Cellulosimicrobium composti TaxID=2672572 RepID=A0A6N7ZN98_9MICO|nr:hypothetical protein [Cellulosimicrobium composti]
MTDEAFSQLTPSAGLVVQQDGGSSVGTLALIFNGCEGFTDNPHRSGPDASVHGRTRCPGVSPVKQQTTALYRIDWWGDNLMNRVTGQAYNKSGTLEVPVHANCGGAPNRGYRGVSNHLADYNGQRGTVTTGNEKWFACN